jgi:hypothetical protein
MITALVILNTLNAPGESVPADSGGSTRPAITAKDHNVFHVREYFASIGMKCGPLVGTSFLIGGQASIFESYFNGSVRKRPDGIRFVPSGGAESKQLPVTGLPSEIRNIVESIVFPEGAGAVPNHF